MWLILHLQSQKAVTTYLSSYQLLYSGLQSIIVGLLQKHVIYTLMKYPSPWKLDRVEGGGGGGADV